MKLGISRSARNCAPPARNDARAHALVRRRAPTVAADNGRIQTQEPTIHDDDDYARKQGLPGIIADGMISTNWIMGLLMDTFGEEFVYKGKLRTKYIAPIYEDQVVISCARVTAIGKAGDAASTRLTSGARTTDQEIDRRPSNRIRAGLRNGWRSDRHSSPRLFAHLCWSGGNAGAGRSRRRRHQGRGARAG